jgi:hypothetical protein
MMNMLNSRLSYAALIVAAAVLLPAGAFAQDASAAMGDNASNFIGGLVIWLLPIGGAIAVGVMRASDKSAQQNRVTRR